MALFGNLGQPMLIPGYGGGMFDPQGGIAGMSSGLDAALMQNQQMAQQKPKKKGFGEFLRVFAGTLGDSLTGNPVYSQQQQQMAELQAQEEWYERKRQDELADYEARKGIDAQYAGPEMPGIAKEVSWVQSLPPEERERAMQIIQTLRPGNFVPPSPVTMGPRDTIEGGADVTAVNPQTGERVRYNPQTQQWEAVGGPSQNGSGGFPGGPF
jgi:hypothetical protein